MSKVKLELIHLVTDRLQIAPEQVEQIDKLYDFGDSLAFLDLISEVEQVFKIRISNEQLEKLNSFNDLVTTVEHGLLESA